MMFVNDKYKRLCNILNRFKSKKLKVSEREHLYSIMAAIRGCDLHCDGVSTLKLLFTARIRYWVFGEKIPGITRKKKPRFTVIIDLLDTEALQPYMLEDKYHTCALEHYIAHVRRALFCMMDLVEDEETKKEINFLYKLALLIEFLILEWSEEREDEFMTRLANLIEEYSDVIYYNIFNEEEEKEVAEQ